MKATSSTKARRAASTASPTASIVGIIIIHQELALVPLLSIAENIFLGNEPAKMGVIDWATAFNRTREVLKKVGLKEKPNTPITNLGVGKQQLVEIAKALSKDVKLLILDEPTASLNEADSDALLKLLTEFRAQGITSILISHKINELAKVADSITVLRDGTTVETIDCHKEKISEGRIIKSMVGREMSDRYPHRQPKIGEKLLEIKNWKVEHPHHAGREVVKGVNLHVNARRDRRHRRPDGGGAHRTGDERVRPRLRPQRARRGDDGGQARRPLDHSEGGGVRHRLRHRGPQDARLGAAAKTSRATSPSPICRASPGAASSTRRASSRSPTAIARR